MLLIGGFFGSFLVAGLLVQSGAAVLESSGTQTHMALTQPVVEQTVLEQAPVFPMQIPGTTLVAQHLGMYEGGYLEDEPQEYVVDVAALLLRNTAPVGIESAQVVLQWDGGSFVFEVQMLPAEKSVLVLERDRQLYCDHAWTGCTGTQMAGEGDWTAYDAVTIEETDLAVITVENISDRTLYDVRLYYKSYLDVPGILIGGVTHSIGIRELAAGEIVEVRPYRYARGYSRVVRIRYSSAESGKDY